MATTITQKKSGGRTYLIDRMSDVRVLLDAEVPPEDLPRPPSRHTGTAPRADPSAEALFRKRDTP